MSNSTQAAYAPTQGLFAVATIARDPADVTARALSHFGLLRFHALGTRRGASGVPVELTRLNPKIMGLAYLGTRMLPSRHHEAFRYRLHPWFDRWTRTLVEPGDHLISSFGFANDTFRDVRAHGGKTFYSAGNSHPESMWALVQEEHKRWNYPHPPYAEFQHKRLLEMMPLVDYVLSPSTFVSQSFIQRGFRPEQVLKIFYPVDLSCFYPSPKPRKKDQPLKIISTGQLSLRKGTPYMLDAFRIVLRHYPSARLLLIENIHDSVKPLMARYSDLPIDWSPPLPHPALAERLRSADVFVLPSLEEGLVRAALEAMACGLPVVITPNTGLGDFVEPNVNGEIVPTRDANAIADAILKWAERVHGEEIRAPIEFNPDRLSYDQFETQFMEQLTTTGLIRKSVLT